jgi:hypothetical protein
MNAQLQIVSHGLRGPVSLDRLPRMGSRELQKMHKEMFGSLPFFNPEQLRRRIAFGLQIEKEGGLPVSARQRALAIAGEAGSRIRVAAKASVSGLIRHSTVTGLISDHDPRVPMPGSVIVKEYRGQTIVVHVFESGFEYDGRRFSSLSAMAKEITGTKWNGLLFFGLAGGKARGH